MKRLFAGESAALVLALLCAAPLRHMAAEPPAIIFNYADRYTFFNAHEEAGVPMPGVTFAEVPLGTLLSDQYAHLGLRFLDGNDVTVAFNTEEDDDYVLAGGNSFSLQFTPPIGSLGLDFGGSLRVQLFLGGVPLGVSDTFADVFGGVIREDGRFDRAVLSNPSGGSLEIYNLYFYPTPTLAIRKLTSSELQVSWSTNASRYTLEYNEQLGASGWRAVTNTPTITGSQMVVTVEATAPQRFFRLRGH